MCDCEGDCVPPKIIIGDQKMLILPEQIQIGSHLPFEGLLQSIQQALSIGMYSVQVYFGSRSRYNRASISAGEIGAIRKLLAQHPVNIYTHACLSYNLAGNCRLKKFAWDGDNEVDNMVMAAIKGLDYELSVLNQLAGFGKLGVVVHPGWWIRDAKTDGIANPAKITQACQAISQSLNLLCSEGDAKILLELCAGELGRIGANLDELAQIRNGCSEKIQKRIGFCVDTAHVHGSGLYDLRTRAGVDRMYADIDKYGHVELIHLNDSLVALGSRKDRHQSLGCGEIWGHDLDPLKYLLEQAGERKIPLILETTFWDIYTVGSLVSL